MSTGAECQFTEREPGQWYYWLQDYPYGSSEEGQTYGPFSTSDQAERHLSAHHANPGGWSMDPHPDSHGLGLHKELESHCSECREVQQAHDAVEHSRGAHTDASWEVRDRCPGCVRESTIQRLQRNIARDQAELDRLKEATA